MATDYVLSGSTRSGYEDGQQTATYVTNSKTITVTNNTDGRSYNKYTTYPDYIKTSHIGTSTIDLSNIPSSEKVTSISFKGFNNVNNNSSATSYISNVNGTAYTEIAGTNQFLNRELIAAVDDEDIKTFTVSGLSIVCGSGASLSFNVGGAETNLIITITTEPRTIDVIYSGSYPYTWIFTVEEDKWAKSISQMDASSAWTVDGTNKTANPVSTHTDAYINDIDILKGLTFTYSSTSDLSLNWGTTKYLHFNGTLKLSNLGVGQTITFDSDADVTGDASVGGTTGKVFTVTTAGTAAFTVNTNIRSIAVTKTDLTGFALNTSDVLKYDNANYNSASVKTAINTLTFDYDAAAPYLRLKLNMDQGVVVGDVATNTNSYFSITNSSNTDVIDISTPGTAAGSANADGKNRVYLYGVHVLKPGTSTLTFRFEGTSAVNAATCTGTITVNKAAQSISYPNSDVTIYYGGTIDNTLSETNNPSVNTVTYVSSDTHVATVASDGTVTVQNAGTCTITATLPGNDYYEESVASYTLTVNATQSAPTITMTQNPETSQATVVANGATVNTTYGNTVTVRGACSVTGPMVKYSSSNTSVATVDANGVVTTKNGGTVTITVYTESYQGYPAASVSYTLNIDPSSFTLKFLPSEGYVNVGATITPQMSLPTLVFADVTSITASSDDISIATVPTNLMLYDGSSYPYLEISEGKVNRFLPIITGVAEGTTTIRISFVSNNYTSTEATYTVHVTAAGTRNFSWADGSGTPTYTVYKGDYMKLPKITGNSNGNNSYSSGANKKYVYNIQRLSNKVTWNTDNYKLYEGTPNIDIVDGETTGTLTDHAIVFFAKGQSSSGVPDTLFVFAKEVGTVTIRATDPQNSSLYCDATLNIIDKASTIDTDASSKIATMSFPYTWDFTGDFDITDIAANSHYWERYSDRYSAGDGFFNVDWADIDGDDNYNERCFKYFIAGAATSTRAGNYMPLFYGMEMSLQSSGYAPKIDRVSIRDYNSANPGAARFVISGGTTQIRLPKVTTQPGSYRIYMKIRTADKTVVEVVGGSKKYASNTETSGYTDLLDKNSDAIIFFDVTDTSGSDAGSVINFDNTTIYWIACSTEARTLMRPENTTYAAATYSYGQDLDLIKSNEVNGVTAYYASSFTVDKKDVSAGSTTGAETQYAVMMKPLTSLDNGAATYVKADQGILLKKSADVGDADCYMIANPRNVDSYSASETITGDVKNYLVGTGANSANISGRGKDGDDDYTNFLMGYAYKYYTDVTDPNSGSAYRFDRDWSFYPLIVSGTYNLAAQRCYLKIPGNLYVDRDGNLVEMPLSSRRSAGESAEAPATKAALSIVFDDDPLTGQGTTGISTVATETTIDSDAWYTLQGVRVDVPAKGGIYIHKGRKIVVK